MPRFVCLFVCFCLWIIFLSRLKAFVGATQALVLTHFSQRYPHIPVLPADGTSATGFAFDYMRLPFRHLARLPALLPALQVLFAEAEAKEETEDCNE
jgi:hypothetical protein